MSHIRIVSKGSGPNTEIWLDGRKLEKCFALHLEVDAASVVHVTLAFHAATIDVDSQAEVTTDLADGEVPT